MTNTSPEYSSGTLFVVATPIGNLQDMSFRAQHTLQTVDLIAAEDTRVAGQLLNHLGISKRLISCHQHNQKRGAESISAALASGKQVALITDAGTPALSDPGAIVVADVAAAGFKVIPIPGPSALTAAISASGLDQGEFYFSGFLPHRGKARSQTLERLSAYRNPIILFESPHRILTLLSELQTPAFSGRPICVARELTKRFERWYRGSAIDIEGQIRSDDYGLKGEFVIVIGEQAPAEATPTDETTNAYTVSLMQLCNALERIESTRTASEIIEALTQIPRKKAYQLMIDHGESRGKPL